MDAEMLVRISTAFDEHPTLLETDAFLRELASIRRKDDQIHDLADQLLDYRRLLTRGDTDLRNERLLTILASHRTRDSGGTGS